MRLLSSATQHRVTLPLTGMCHTTTSMRKMQTHTCAYRKGGLSRAVHPTFGREIVQNPVKSQWQGKTQRGHSSHLAPSPDSCLSKPASATCGRSWLSQLISASGCTQQVSPQSHLLQLLIIRAQNLGCLALEQESRSRGMNIHSSVWRAEDMTSLLQVPTPLSKKS